MPAHCRLHDAIFGATPSRHSFVVLHFGHTRSPAQTLSNGARHFRQGRLFNCSGAALPIFAGLYLQ